jgi:single-strand DNA-binding protein
MFHDAPVYLSGYLAQEPKFKKVTGDISSTKLRIAYTARRQDRETGEWSDGTTTFVNVQCWRQLADHVTTSLRKGEPVLVFGRLRIRHYDDAEGRSRIAVEIEANSVGHDLTRGVAHFSRARFAGRPAEAPAADGPESGDAGEPGGPGEPRAGAADGDGVVDEQAVAEFARELSALGPDAVGEAQTGAAETGAAETGAAETAPAADGETESVASAQS